LTGSYWLPLPTKERLDHLLTKRASRHKLLEPVLASAAAEATASASADAGDPVSRTPRAAPKAMSSNIAALIGAKGATHVAPPEGSPRAFGPRRGPAGNPERDAATQPTPVPSPRGRPVGGRVQAPRRGPGAVRVAGGFKHAVCLAPPYASSAMQGKPLSATHGQRLLEDEAAPTADSAATRAVRGYALSNPEMELLRAAVRATARREESRPFPPPPRPREVEAAAEKDTLGDISTTRYEPCLSPTGMGPPSPQTPPSLSRKQSMPTLNRWPSSVSGADGWELPHVGKGV